MNKKWKKGITLSLVATLALTASVANTGKTSAAEGAPVYVDGDEIFVNEFVIGAWCEPYGTHEDLEKYKQAGFNTLYLNNENPYNSSSLNHMVKRAEQYDLYYMIANGGNRDNPVSIRIADNSLINIKDDPRFLGVMSCDEPLGGAHAEVDQLKPNKNMTQETMIKNGLYKNYNTIYHYLADEYQYIKQTYGNKIFDAVIAIGYEPDDFGYGAVDAMEEMVYPLMTAEDRTVSYDSYPFLSLSGVKGVTKMSNMIYKSYRMRKAADDAGGAKYRIYYYGQEWNKETREYDDARNVTYQIYTSMTYGFNMFVAYKYNAYWNGFTSDTNYIHNHYGYTEYWWYNVVALQEIKKYDRVYLAFADDWKGTMFVEGTQAFESEYRPNQGYAKSVEYIDTHERIASVTSTQDLLIGTFKDKDGRDGFMLANQVDPYKKTGTSVEIKFNNANKALVIVDGEEKTVNLENGVFKTDLKYGGGAFVVPYNA